MRGRKIISTIVAITMIFSAMVVLNQLTNFKFVENASATTVILSKDGSEGAWAKLTCGEIITVKVTDHTLNASQTYYVKVWNGSAWVNLQIDGSKKSDKYGDISLEVHVPGWSEIGANPLTNSGDPGNLSNGQYNISLFDKYGTQVGSNQTITIGNLYYVKYFYGGNEITEITYNKTYTDLTFKVYNWTGSKLALEEDETFTYTIYDVDGSQIYQQTGEDETWSYDLMRSENNYGNGAGNLENYLWVNVTSAAEQYSNVTLPVKLNMSFTILPADNEKEWGDTITVKGYLYDGQGNPISGYHVYLYSPVNSSTRYYPIAYTTTYGSGKFTLDVDTGSGSGKDDPASAGTWYVGTKRTGTYRINETDQLNITDFISYASFVVGTRNEAVVSVVNSGDIISGFNQTINITVANASWMNENEYRNMNVHVTGLTGWWNGVEYDDDDIVPVAATVTKYTDSKAWYEFNYRFNETGTATVWVSWDGNLTSIAKDGVAAQTSTYSAYYNNEDLLANITGSKTFTVASPDNMNLIVQGTMVDAVQVDDLGSNKYKNSSAIFNLTIYGDTEDEPMNATLEITGCGLNILINESDTAAENEYLVSKGNGWYRVKIAPKVAGTLTIKATNDTNNYTATKDYTIKGLSGSVTTSVGDDLEIPVKTSESITVTVTNGQYADVYLTLFNENWGGATSVNYTTGDNTEGNGKDGKFVFYPDDDYLDEIGYIVCVASAGGYYMYDIVEITPVHDLSVNITTPDAGNRTLTVGVPQDIVVEVRGPDGSILSDVDSVTGKLYDTDGDLKQTITFTEVGDTWSVEDQILWFPGTLKITAKNNTGEDEHDGNVSMDVEYANVAFSPDTLTAGIGTTNVTVEITCTDANGNPLPSGTTVYININTTDGNTTANKASLSLDSDGKGEFKVTKVGDGEGHINITFEDAYAAGVGNESNGQLTISFPYFVIDPTTIYIGQSNIVTIWAYEADQTTPIKGINITLWGNTITQPEPVETDANGKVIFSIQPDSSGIANVTIARNVRWVNGQKMWTNAVITDSYITIDALKTFTIILSKSPIYEDETLIVTVKTGTTPVEGASVTFGTETATTDTNGQATFIVPDPGVDSATFDITVNKTGYTTATKSITVINKWDIKIVAPSGTLETGKEYTFTITAKGQPLAGATVTFEGKEYTSDGDGKVKLTMPTKKGDYTITATYTNYKDGTLTISVKTAGTPGFELLTLIIALGVAFILLRRRRH